IVVGGTPNQSFGFSGSGTFVMSGALTVVKTNTNLNVGLGNGTQSNGVVSTFTMSDGSLTAGIWAVGNGKDVIGRATMSGGAATLGTGLSVGRNSGFGTFTL